jgi:L-ascorbate metabolism protein UlaG (beta-lactamase superfamily)
VKIKFIGHSCFVITSENNIKILTDPFALDNNLALNYIKPNENVDIVTVSHEHFDHNSTEGLPGKPIILKKNVVKTLKDVSIRSIVGTWHDDSTGKERGPNTIFYFTVDDVNICHLGDLGHQLTKDEIKAIGKVDVLLIPIGGVFTIDADGAGKVADSINPKIVIPMHFKTNCCLWLTSTTEDFTRGKKNVRKLNTNEVDITASGLPDKTEVFVLKYAGQA